MSDEELAAVFEKKRKNIVVDRIMAISLGGKNEAVPSRCFKKWRLPLFSGKPLEVKSGFQKCF